MIRTRTIHSQFGSDRLQMHTKRLQLIQTNDARYGIGPNDDLAIYMTAQELLYWLQDIERAVVKAEAEELWLGQ